MTRQLDYAKASSALMLAEAQADQVYRALMRSGDTVAAERIYRAYRELSGVRVLLDIAARRQVRETAEVAS